MNDLKTKRTLDPVLRIFIETIRDPEQIFLFQLSREMIQTNNVDMIRHVVDFVLENGLVELCAHRLALKVTGYEHALPDPVELTEVRTYMERLDACIPFMPFFLENRHSESLVFYCACLSDTWFEEDEMFIDEDDLDIFLDRKSEIISDLCSQYGIDSREHIEFLQDALRPVDDADPEDEGTQFFTHNG